MSIFEDGFESGDFTAWTGTVLGSAPDYIIEVNSDFVHHGSYTMMAEHTDGWTFLCYAHETVTDRSTLFMRFYVRFDEWASLNNNDRYFNIGVFLDAGINLICGLRVRSDGTDRTIALQYLDGAGTTVVGDDTVLALDTWYCLEMKAVVHGTDGEYRVWLDEDEIITVTGKDTDAYGTIDRVVVGSYYSVIWDGRLDRYYIDCVVVDDAYIGPEAATGNKASSSIASLMIPMIVNRLV